MIVLQNSHQNLSEYISFLFKTRFEFDKKKSYPTISRFYSKKDVNLIKKCIISRGKTMNSGNYNYDYAHSFFEEDF